MADFGKLRQRTKADKGAPPVAPVRSAGGKGPPPAPEETNKNLEQPPRTEKEKNVHLYFSVPQSVVDAFNAEALSRNGYYKGSKSDLFMTIWQDYEIAQGIKGPKQE